MNNIEIKNIDFGMLKKQKKTLLYTLSELEKCGYGRNPIRDENGNEMPLSDLTGILNLIDHIQDEAVKQLDLDENEVFDLEE